MYRMGMTTFFRLNNLSIILGITIPRKRTERLMVNPGQFGYYIVNYDTDTWDYIIAQLKLKPEVFSEADRASILHDAFSLAE